MLLFAGLVYLYVKAAIRLRSVLPEGVFRTTHSSPYFMSVIADEQIEVGESRDSELPARAIGSLTSLDQQEGLRIGSHGTYHRE